MNQSTVASAAVPRGRSVAAASAMEVTVRGDTFAGFVVIDSIVEGRCAGGVRIAHDLRIEEVRELAREMTLKYALFDQPRGGAKAGVRLAEGLTPEAQLAAMEDFGRGLAPLLRNGIYSPGMDMNCGPDRLRAIYRGAGIGLGTVTDTSWFTALSVYHALLATASRIEVEDRPVTLAVEGFGSVARHLAARLDPHRFRFVAVSTIEGAVRWDEPVEPGVLVQAKDRHGDGCVREVGGSTADPEEVFAAAADVLLPSSRTWVLDLQRAAAVRTRAVVPISNAPYVEGAVGLLHAAGVLTLPGYLVNVGGVLASSLHDQGLSRPEVERLFEQEYRSVVDAVLDLADACGRPATEVTESLARAHMSYRRPYVERSLGSRIFGRLIRPRMPRSLRAGRARAEFLEAVSRLRGEIAAGEIAR